MNRLMAAAVVLSLILAGSADAASKRAARSSSGSPDNIVYLNLAGFGYGYGGLGYERAFGPDNSLSVDLMFRTTGGTGYNFTSIGVAPAYRWYLGDHGKMTGWYAGPKAYLVNFSFTYDVTTVSSTPPYAVTKQSKTASSMLFGAGGMGGHQWIWPNGFMANAGAELLFLTGSIDLGLGAPSIAVSGAGVGLVGSIGYAF